MLRDRPDVPADLRPEGLLRFRDFADLAEKDPERSYRPPLLLTATNLNTRRLELISSLDDRYLDVPIAKAVRASAGFPVFFRPLELPGAPDGGGWFIDGGVVSNFPIWAFSEAFRGQLRESRIYDDIAPLPWIRIGLRVIERPEDRMEADVERDVSQPFPFFRAMLSMFVGTARNQLEEIISSRSARAIVVREVVKKAKGDDFLAVDNLNAERVEAMIQSGFDWAHAHLTRIDPVPNVAKHLRKV